MISTVDVHFDRNRSPLMVGVQSTTASLVKCYEGSLRKIIYPQLREFEQQRTSVSRKNNREIPDQEETGDQYPAPAAGDDIELPF